MEVNREDQTLIQTKVGLKVLQATLTVILLCLDQSGIEIHFAKSLYGLLT